MKIKTAEEIFYEVFKAHNCYHFPELKKLVELCMSEYAAQQKSEWVPVSERLPEPNVRVWAYSHFHKEQFISEIDEKGRWWITFTMLKGVTHWQPLPTPPKK